MIKGSQKQMIVLRTGSSRYFDEAYFVLRREIKTTGRERGDILAEANRILAESGPSSRRCVPRIARRGLWFLLGAACGALLAVAAVLLF